ncbi:putative defense protein 3 [Procambarus clarkii]|uniref:putative defense protein 3 n=1 Tax=Procambarus clarkii TaxID=6728 RepID=UPI001E67059B|nr:putative defense protein 3 [Procambarus clarkii]
MMYWLLTVGVLTASLLGQADAYPTGAPKAACATLEPQHDSNDSPIHSDLYAIFVEVVDDIQLKVTLNTTGKEFKGFILAADDPTGVLTPLDSHAQVLDCPDQPTVTHTSRVLKQSVTLHWQRDTGLAAVNFLATAVTAYEDDYITGISYSYSP